ncbi:MAG: hypothetical protein M3N12_00885 [Verrucomicrobiota bacterium]|nr:hypothetical protein [Verrucomicrobiota bacterium]
MKKFCTVLAALALLVSCSKQQSDEEKRAEVEKQVQERLAAERQTEEQKRLAQQQADLEAREKALADKEAATTSTTTMATTTVTEPTPIERETTTRRDRVTSETTERRSSASYGTFYRKLEPYGAWRDTSDYGYVWQPREAEDRNWRPYTEGHWVYTDAGWTWVSEEPFGWATYHYGRWVRLRRVGWVWVPGEEWAPAWVSWRTSKDYVGWAPLPPEARFDRKHGIHNWADNYYDISPDQYSFVPGDEFGSRRVKTSVVPVERNVTIVIDTTNVTNITYANTMVVNQGPNFEEMRTRSHQPIERFRLQRRTETTSDDSRATVRGEFLEMHAPVISRVPGIDRPQTIKETLTQSTVEKTWSAETDRSASERARVKMRTEAAPPADAPSKTFVRPDNVPVTSTPASTVAASTAPSSPVPVTTPASTAAARTAPATPTPAMTPASTVAATKPPATPTPASTVAATPKPTATAVSTPRPSVSLAPTVAPTATPVSTPIPSVAASPSATVRHPVPSRPPRVTPSSTIAPAISVAPAVSASPAPIATPPALSTPPVRIKPRPTLPPNADTMTPQPVVPSVPPAIQPAPTLKPAETVPPESVAKPLPVYSPPTTSRALTPRVPPVSTAPPRDMNPEQLRTTPPAKATPTPATPLDPAVPPPASTDGKLAPAVPPPVNNVRPDKRRLSPLVVPNEPLLPSPSPTAIPQ